PAVAVKLVPKPAVKSDPTGIALTTSEDRLLLSPAAPLTVTPRLSAIAVPSTPISATGATLGAVGFTVTSSVPLVVVDRLPSASFAVAAIPSVKFASFAGVMVRLDRFQLCTSTEVLPAVAVKLLP